ncbi:MAG: histidinol phosphate phosphatase domain-containing protein [Deltaproteobacteria bacterium]|nr:histidinol phosphate phosphatase domain-containing protein [Deltaproteobacteria bacterium]
MIDLHTHSIFSDGELIPAELAQRAYAAGYKVLAITDHVDHSNIDFIIPRIIKVCSKITEAGKIKVFPGVEITHIAPAQIADLADEARKLGAKIVIVHGETIVEPVPAGTNLAALKSSIDILAHPGLLTEEDARLAADRGIYLEITTRKGHSLSNGHVAQMARKFKASLILNNDAHSPADFVSSERATQIARGAGLTDDEISAMLENSRRMVAKLQV